MTPMMLVSAVLHECGANVDDVTSVQYTRAALLVERAFDNSRAACTPVLEAARAWAAAETETPHPSSTGVGDWAERRAAARDVLLAAVRGAS